VAGGGATAPDAIDSAPAELPCDISEEMSDCTAEAGANDEPMGADATGAAAPAIGIWEPMLEPERGIELPENSEESDALPGMDIWPSDPIADSEASEPELDGGIREAEDDPGTRLTLPRLAIEPVELTEPEIDIEPGAAEPPADPPSG